MLGDPSGMIATPEVQRPARTAVRWDTFVVVVVFVFAAASQQ